jgi:hypothetical protein
MTRWVTMAWLLSCATARGDSESLRRARDLSLQREPDRILASQRANLFNDSPRAGAMVSGPGVSGRFDFLGRHVYLSDGRVGTVFGNVVQYSDGSTGWVNGSFISVPEPATAAQQKKKSFVTMPQNVATTLPRAVLPPRICVTVDSGQCVPPAPVVTVPALPVIYVPAPAQSGDESDDDDEPRPAASR